MKLSTRPLLLLALGAGLVACDADGRRLGRGDGGAPDLRGHVVWDGGGDLGGAGGDLAGADLDGAGGGDLAGGAPDLRGGAPDLSSAPDLRGGGAPDLSTGGGVITGGPCSSGSTGRTAFRIHWINAGGTAQVQYEAFGLPDRSREHAAAYGYTIGFTPQFADPFLGPGGLQLDGSDFVDLELSTVGVSTIRSATLSLYGRSYDTTASGSFSWQSFTGTGATPTDFVSNVAPYQWYSADLGAALTAGDGTLLLRIKAGPSSGSLVVNRIEICLDAD